MFLRAGRASEALRWAWGTRSYPAKVAGRDKRPSRRCPVATARPVQLDSRGCHCGTQHRPSASKRVPVSRHGSLLCGSPKLTAEGLVAELAWFSSKATERHKPLVQSKAV